MSKNDSAAPLLPLNPDALDSLARDCLQSNLDARLSLKHKRSWFANIRDAVHRSARGFVAPLMEKNVNDDALAPDLEAGAVRPSVESSTSRPSKAQTMPSRGAFATLRRHVPTRKKRGSIYSLVSETDGNTGGTGPENCPPPHVRTPSGHRRHISLVSSIKGSLRTISHKPARPSFENCSPAKIAALVPLPSSPINIPTLAPELSLDLGPAYMMPTDFGSTIGLDSDPALFGTTGRPRECKTFLRVGNATPPEALLQLPPSSPPRVPVCQPSTPLPGTTFGFDFDGISDERLFERGVETPPGSHERSGQGVRPMRSLDAIAKICIRDEKDASPQMTDKIPPTPELCRVEPATNAFKEAADSAQVGMRSMASASTSSSIPPDMQSLCRQGARLVLEQGSDTIEQLDSRIQVFSSGTPSPTRAVRLPLRPRRLSQTEAHDQFAPQMDSSAVQSTGAGDPTCDTDSVFTDYVEFKTQHLFHHAPDESPIKEYYDDAAVPFPTSSDMAVQSRMISSDVPSQSPEARDSSTLAGVAEISRQLDERASISSGSPSPGHVLLCSPALSEDSLDSISMASDVAARERSRDSSCQVQWDDDHEAAASSSSRPSSAVPVAKNQTPAFIARSLNEKREEVDADSRGMDAPRNSEDSMIVSLQDAVLDINKLQEHLDELATPGLQPRDAADRTKESSNAAGGQDNAP